MVNYSVFIVRCWQEDARLRFRIEDPHSGEEQLFDGLDGLITYLNARYSVDETQTDNEGESDALFD